MAKYFRFPFALNGDKTSVGDTTGDTSVSYDTGYTSDYEQPKTNPSRRVIERAKMNQLHFDATENIKQWQEQVYPDFIPDAGTGDPYSYRKGAIVSYSGNYYRAIVDGTTTIPTDISEWVNISSGSIVLGKPVVISDEPSYINGAIYNFDVTLDNLDEIRLYGASIIGGVWRNLMTGFVPVSELVGTSERIGIWQQETGTPSDAAWSIYDITNTNFTVEIISIGNYAGRINKIYGIKY